MIIIDNNDKVNIIYYIKFMSVDKLKVNKGGMRIRFEFYIPDISQRKRVCFNGNNFQNQ